MSLWNRKARAYLVKAAESRPVTVVPKVRPRAVQPTAVDRQRVRDVRRALDPRWTTERKGPMPSDTYTVDYVCWNCSADKKISYGKGNPAPRDRKVACKNCGVIGKHVKV